VTHPPVILFTEPKDHQNPRISAAVSFLVSFMTSNAAPSCYANRVKRQ